MKSYLDFGSYEQGLCEDLALVIDVSGSMDLPDYTPTRLAGAIKAALSLIEVKANEAPLDRVGVIRFAIRGRVVQGLTRLQEGRESIRSAISSMEAGGGTNIRAGLSKASQLLRGSSSSGEEGILGWLKRCFVEAPGNSQGTEPDRARRILLLSDGEATFGGDPVMVAKELKEEGIVIDVVGIAAKPTAWGFDERQLRAIASSPEGGREHYFFISDTQALIRKFENLALQIKPLEV